MRVKAFQLAALSALFAASLSGAETVGGVELPDGSTKVGENRYRAPEDFDATLKFYKTAYPPAGYPRKNIVNQPGIKAIHIANPGGKGFEGLNIYQTPEEVRIYVIPSPPEPKGAKKKGTKEKR